MRSSRSKNFHDHIFLHSEVRSSEITKIKNILIILNIPFIPVNRPLPFPARYTKSESIKKALTPI